MDQNLRCATLETRQSISQFNSSVGLSPSAGRPHVRGIVENVRGAAERKDAARRESVEKARGMTSERPPARLCNNEECNVAEETKDVKTWGPQSRFDPDSQSSDKGGRTIDTQIHQ